MADVERVQVVCRFRPQNDKEAASNGTICATFPDEFSVKIVTPGGEKPFSYDKVFNMESTQLEVYEYVGKPVVNAVLMGYNGTVLSYGQTSSGKTHTMLGPEGGKEEYLTEKNVLGLIPRIMEDLFAKLQKHDENLEWRCVCSIVELYMERFSDLVSPAGKDDLKLREDVLEGRGVYIENVTGTEVVSTAQVMELLKQAMRNRTTAATKANDTSSRSHTIFTLTLEQLDRLHGGGKTRSQLNLVDLAGSEKIAKTGAEGQRLEEAKKINLSLTLLGNVINKLTDGVSTHIPYRDSKLTRLLQNSFGGNSRTTLLCNCSPSTFNSNETIGTLLFASRAKRIKNRPVINRELTADELKAQLAKAQEEIKMLRVQLGLPSALPSSLTPSAPSTPRRQQDDETQQLLGQLRDAKAELDDRTDEIAKYKQEAEYWKNLQAETQKKLDAMTEKAKEHERMSKYWAKKFQDLSKSNSSQGPPPPPVAIKKKVKKTTSERKVPSSASGGVPSLVRAGSLGNMLPSRPSVSASKPSARAKPLEPIEQSFKPATAAIPTPYNIVPPLSAGSGGAGASGSASPVVAGDDDLDLDEFNLMQQMQSKCESLQEELDKTVIREKQLRAQVKEQESEHASLMENMEQQLDTMDDLQSDVDRYQHEIQIMSGENLKALQAVSERDVEIARLTEILTRHHIAHESSLQTLSEKTDNLEQNLTVAQKRQMQLLSEKTDLQLEAEQLKEDAAQREMIQVVEVDLNLQKNDICAIEKEIDMLTDLELESKEHRAARVTTIRSEIAQISDYLVREKTVILKPCRHPEDEYRRSALMQMLTDMIDQLESLSVRCF